MKNEDTTISIFSADPSIQEAHDVQDPNHLGAYLERLPFFPRAYLPTALPRTDLDVDAHDVFGGNSFAASALNSFQFLAGLDDEEDAGLGVNLARPIGLFSNRSPVEKEEDLHFASQVTRSILFRQGASLNNELPAQETSDHVVNHPNLTIPYTTSCHTTKNVSEDSVKFSVIWGALKSEHNINQLMSGVRVMLFGVLLPFILVQLSQTRNWFVAGQLIPSLTASFCFPDLGSQCKNTVMIAQVVLVIFVLGKFADTVNLSNHETGWYMSVFVIPFVIGLLGDMPAKRLMMIYSVTMLEVERQLNTMDDPWFCLRYSRDFFLAALFAQVSALLPYPILSCKLADSSMKELHHLYAASFGNAIKAFWAPVLLDAEIAKKQVPWELLREKEKELEQHMEHTSYEPVESGLKNLARAERLKHLYNIRWYLYSLAAGADLNTEIRKSYIINESDDDLKGSRKRFQQLAFKLSHETVKILEELGTAILPEEVIKIDFTHLVELASALENAINTERDETLLRKQFAGHETNNLFRLFAFHTTMVNLTNELIKVELWAKRYSPQKYPNWWQRMVKFTITDVFGGFWQELPKRMLLSTPRDIRVVKDAARYSIGLLVVVSFAHLTATNDKSSYFFGMSFLGKIAQQTASETVKLGVMRVCGLAFGVSFGFLVGSQSDQLLWKSVIFNMILGIIGCFVASHDTYGQVGQYAVIAMIACGDLTQQTPEDYINRLVANVFAFAGYLLVTSIVFPVDPFRVVSNYGTKISSTVNEINQTVTILVCCPITLEGEESKYLLNHADSLLLRQRIYLLEAIEWNGKAAEEPTVRGGMYPEKAYVKLFTRIAELSSMQQGLVESMRTLHRRRFSEPSIMIYSALELVRPFLLDTAQLVQEYFQLVIDATDHPKLWSLKAMVVKLWRCELAVYNLRRVIGNIQRVLLYSPKSLDDSKGKGNKVSLVEKMGKLSQSGTDSAAVLEAFREVVATSPVDRADLCVFETIIVNYILFLNTMTLSLENVIEIHEYELECQVKYSSLFAKKRH